IICTDSPATFSPFFSYNTTAPTEIYTLSLHDALPICRECVHGALFVFLHVLLVSERQALHHDEQCLQRADDAAGLGAHQFGALRSEEHTSELQSRGHLVCRLLLEKKKKKQI